MESLGLQVRSAGNVSPQAALAWAMMQRAPGGSSSSSSAPRASKVTRLLHPMGPGETPACTYAADATVEIVLASACLGLAGHTLTRRRRHRIARQALGKLIQPPLPPYMQADSQALLPQTSQDLTIHPATGRVEDALTSGSLRTLCKALALAAGSYSNPADGLERIRRPKMDQTLTIRALLRFCELRHTAADDLQPRDFIGESGQGVRALLKHCRNYQLEVAAALESREEETVGMIRAFHDQADVVKKYLPFFRNVLEKCFPVLLRQTVEPLHRLIGFLDSYGEVQLSFLYEAAKDKVIKARLNEMQPRQLLEVTDKWVSQARNGELAIVQSHKARVVVRHAASLDIELPPRERAEWMSLAIWGSVLESTPELELIEDRVRKGALYRGDPVEMLSLAEGMGDISGFNHEMFEIVRAPINQAMLRAGPERAALALASLTFQTRLLKKPADKAQARLLLPERITKKIYKWQRGEDRPLLKLKKKDPPKPPKPKEALAGLIVKVLAFFSENMPLTALEYVLAKWVLKNFRLEACYEVARDHLLRLMTREENLVDPERDDADEVVPPGSLARSSNHLVALGLPAYTLAPAVDWLLCQSAGWSEKRAFPEEVVEEDAATLERAMIQRRIATTKLVESSLPLLSHLWPQRQEGDEDASLEQFSLRNADELLRLVGRTEDRDGKKRKADVAADELLKRLSSQLMFDDLPQKAESAMCDWRQTQPETSLSTLAAPFLLEAAHIGANQGIPEQRPVGTLSRSIVLLAQAINMEEISLESAEWALMPFEAADASNEAVSLVAASCAVGGVPEDIMSETCTAWLELGCQRGNMGLQYRGKGMNATVSYISPAAEWVAGLVQLRKASQRCRVVVASASSFVSAVNMLWKRFAIRTVSRAGLRLSGSSAGQGANGATPCPSVLKMFFQMCGFAKLLKEMHLQFGSSIFCNRHLQIAASLHTVHLPSSPPSPSTTYSPDNVCNVYGPALADVYSPPCAPPVQGFHETAIAFSGCFPGGLDQEGKVSQRACNFFRAEVSNVLALDRETEAWTAYQQAGIKAITEESSLATHPCYGRKFQVGQEAKYEEHISFRVMAVTLGINLEKTPSYWIPFWDTHEEITGAPCDAARPLWRRLALLSPLESSTGWVVNVGAGDGSCSYDAAREVFRDLTIFKAGDPANCLLHAGFQGILFEGDPEKAALLRQVFAGREGIWVIGNATNPFKVLQQVAAYRDSLDLQVQPELLKVDVDNCDCCFVAALLERGLRPRHIHVEVSSLVPPPIFFRPVAFDPSIQGDSSLEIGPESGFRGHMVHCSLSAFAEQLEPFDYKLVDLYLHDAHFARQDVVQGDAGEGIRTSPDLWHEIGDLEMAWNAGFYCHPLRPTQFIEVQYKKTFLYDYRQWSDKSLSIEERLRLLRDYLDRWQKPRNQYVLRVQEKRFVTELPKRAASSLCDATGGLALLLDTIDGKPPSLSELARAKEAILEKLGGKGLAALADAVALSWSSAMPGLPPSVAASHFEQWWRGQETRQELVSQVATAGLQELSWNVKLKLQATFADKKPTEYSSPAWRVEGVQKVTWFVPAEVVSEASKTNPAGLKKERKKPPGFIGSKTAQRAALEKSGGRCMYCSGTHKLRAKHFWPPELGGTDFASNVSSCCELCSDMHEALGSKRWREVLSADPEQAAEVWWEAQKKASMQAMGFLAQPAE
ncbi:casA [Symbiodinium natans]|uniref:CasA protein n=1 Tax=Symbiodinium natans TaxID=878477 RepID=A0A812V8Q8_9DINO|nr:casA [Symbiodinium natans]